MFKSGIDVNNAKEVIQTAENSDIDFKDNNIYLDKEVINEEIRTIEVSNNVSNVAKIKEVRQLMVEVQRK